MLFVYVPFDIYKTIIEQKWFPILNEKMSLSAVNDFDIEQPIQ